jgi:hypothetical protein
MQREARKALLALRRDLGSWPKVSEYLGEPKIPPGTLWNYQRGKCKMPKGFISDRLGIKPKPRKKPVNWFRIVQGAKEILEPMGYRLEGEKWIQKI